MNRFVLLSSRLSVAPGGGKMREPGNEIAHDVVLLSDVHMGWVNEKSSFFFFFFAFGSVLLIEVVVTMFLLFPSSFILV